MLATASSVCKTRSALQQHDRFPEGRTRKQPFRSPPTCSRAGPSETRLKAEVRLSSLLAKT